MNKPTWIKILSKGVVTLPKEFRQELGLEDGDVAKAWIEGGKLIIESREAVTSVPVAESMHEPQIDTKPVQSMPEAFVLEPIVSPQVAAFTSEEVVTPPFPVADVHDHLAGYSLSEETSVETPQEAVSTQNPSEAQSSVIETQEPSQPPLEASGE